MELSLTTYLIVLPLVFLAAVVDSIGGGGGLISLPGYTLAGLPYGYASGCNKFSASMGTLVATAKYARAGRIVWKPALMAAAGALPGAWLGTQLSLRLSNAFMNSFMLIAIPLVGAFVVLKRDREVAPKPLTRGRLAACLLMGLVMGGYDGFFGPGMGTFLILILTSLMGMDMVSATATSKPINLASNLTSLITRLCAGQVIFALALPAMCLGMTGGWLGSKLALTRGARFIRIVLLLVLALLVVKLAIDLF